MNLGLDKLTDDQLLDLLKEACGELSQRDGYVRTIAQATIVTEADKLNTAKAAAKKAIESEKRKYLGLLTSEIEAAVREEVKSGSLILVPSGEEADFIVSAERSARTKLLKELNASSKQPQKGFTLTVTVDQIIFSSAGRGMRAEVDSRTLAIIQNLCEAMAQKLAAYPKWKYHRLYTAKIVNSPEEEAALGLEWVDAPP